MREPPRQKWTARLILLLLAAAGLGWLASLDLQRKVSTDVLDLIPSDERSPEISMVRTLAGQEEARVLLIAVRLPALSGEAEADRAQRADKAAAVFAKSLAADSSIAEATLLSDPSSRNALAATIFTKRFDLLLPGWLAEKSRQYASSGSSMAWSAWLAEQTAAELEAYLSKAEAMATQDILPSDPLLLVPGLVGHAGSLASSGLASGHNNLDTLVWARSRFSPLVEQGQGPVFAAVESALARTRQSEPKVEVRWTGIARIAAASRARIEHEVTTLNALSLVLVIAVAAVCVRRVHRAVHLVPVVLGSLLGAWVATTASFDRVHILVFVVGSLLAGVAVDYGFYIFLQPLSRPDEPYLERASRLIKPLLASALTTVIGFSFLLWSELPMIRQLGIFVSAGLICALAAALLWFAQIDNSHLETRAFIRKRPKVTRSRSRIARIILVLGGIVAVVGPWRLHWKDDIRELEIPTPELNDNDALVRGLFGETEGRVVYLTRGSTPAEARSSLESFLKWHEGAFPGSKVASLGYALPTEEEWTAMPANLGKLTSFDSNLRAALERHGFEADSFKPFFEAWRDELARSNRPSYTALVAELGDALKGPLSSLLHVGTGASWFATISEQAPGGIDPPASTNTVTDSQLQNLNRLFSRYRVSALELSSVGLGFVGASVFVLYGFRRGIRIFAIPAGACLFAFGVFGLSGATLNLFNLLGAFLGVCLSHNYAIFSAESQGRGEEPPPSIRMSAVAAASSFGVLSLSRIPVVAALGSTVAVIVLAALTITELTPLASKEDTPKDTAS